MDPTSYRLKSDLQQNKGRLADRWHFFVNTVNWLVVFFQLTEEEMKEAGVRFDQQRDE